METVLPVKIKHRCSERGYANVSIAGCSGRAGAGRGGTESGGASSPARRVTARACCGHGHRRYLRHLVSLSAGAADTGGSVKGRSRPQRQRGTRGRPRAGGLWLKEETKPRPRTGRSPRPPRRRSAGTRTRETEPPSAPGERPGFLSLLPFPN